MSTQSHVSAYEQDPTKQADEVPALIEWWDFENHPAVSVDFDDEFDNFTIDLSKLPPNVKFIKFHRG